MNILLLVVTALLIIKIISGSKLGMVREVISFVSLIALSLFVILVGKGLQSYVDGEIFSLVAVVFLLGILGIFHHLLGVVFLPAKLLSKLPIVRTGDRILGIGVGILETILILWTTYTLIMMLDIGVVGTWVLELTADNPILTWFYEHNYLRYWIEQLGAEFYVNWQ